MQVKKAKKNKFFNNLILIGGGVMRKGQTCIIDTWMLDRIRNEKKVKKPKILFIPSASEDLNVYVQDFTKRYQSYGASVESLLLVKNVPSPEIIKRKFKKADLIYFGGGDANLLLDIFTKFNLEAYCIDAVNNNSIISGLSAGAIIWGKKFLNFDRKGNEFVNFRIENGLGWIEKLIVPHFGSSIFKKKVWKLLESNVGFEILAIGDGTAAYWENNYSPYFKKQKGSCLGVYLPVEKLIKKYENREQAL